MNSIGKNIAEHRRNVGITQEQLADKLGISAQAVSKWENDLSEPDASTLLALSKIFGVTVDDLLNGTRVPSVSTDDKKPEDRLIAINVKYQETNVLVKIPAELVIQGDFGVFDVDIEDLGYNPDNYPGYNPDNAMRAIAMYKDTIKMMLEKNIVGKIVDVDSEGARVTITIE